MRRRNALTVTRRPNRVIIRQLLSSGAYMTLFFNRHRACKLWHDYEEGEPCYLWRVGLFIGPWEEARPWYNRRLNREITGDGSLEGLTAASRHLISFCESLGLNHALEILAEDTRRMQAYMRLVRQGRGFVKGVHGDTGEDIIVYRNPKWWDWG